MTKTEKIKYINDTYLRFVDAKNHGHHGSNWWYPTKNTIAYNVKMHGHSKNIEDIRAKMTKRQNDYYSDETLYDKGGLSPPQFASRMQSEYYVQMLELNFTYSKNHTVRKELPMFDSSITVWFFAYVNNN